MKKVLAAIVFTAGLCASAHAATLFGGPVVLDQDGVAQGGVMLGARVDRGKTSFGFETVAGNRIQVDGLAGYRIGSVRLVGGFAFLGGWTGPGLVAGADWNNFMLRGSSIPGQAMTHNAVWVGYSFDLSK